MIIVSMEYKDIEGLVTAVLAEDKKYIEKYKNGIDMHQDLASSLNTTREKAKIVSHGCRYGITPFGIAQELFITEGEAKEIIERYWKIRPEVQNYKERVVMRAHRIGYEIGRAHV